MYGEFEKRFEFFIFTVVFILQLSFLNSFFPVPPFRTPNVHTFQQEMKESVIQTARPVRGRLQRPRPNIRKAGQRQIVEKGETKGIIKKERTILQKDETKKKFLTEVSYCYVIKSSLLMYIKISNDSSDLA